MQHIKIEREGTQVIIPIPESYKDVATLIKSDYYRNAGELLPVYKIWLKTLLWVGSTSVLFWYRVASYKRGWLHLFAKIMLKRGTVKCGLQISSRTKIGYGFLIQHSFGTIVNPDTVIGNNVTLMQFVNIGTSTKNAALIGDCVNIFPMTCVVNDVVIGKNVTVGAGSVVTRSIPDNATAVGSPARVINYDHPAKYIGHKWPVPDISND